MNFEPGYKHVLFKDLNHYLRIDDYLKGYTSAEQELIRKNINAASKDDLLKISGEAQNIHYFNLAQLIADNALIPGVIYAIDDYLTIYLSSEINNDGIHITYGSNKHPSEVYTLITIAITKNKLLPQVTVLSDNPNSIYWTVLYDSTSEILEDGELTKGKIIYLLDENKNQATYDFKNIIWKNGYTFLKNGIENSKECFGNDLCFTNNVVIKIKINNLISRHSNIEIDSTDIDFSDMYRKLIIKTNNTFYIDYLDLETLTHLFYALANNSCIIL